MSATSGGLMLRQAPAKKLRIVRSALMAVGMMAVVSLALAPAAQADDGKAPASTQIAAADGAADALPFRLGMPLRRTDFEVDLKVLLAQHHPSTKSDATAADDTILVALALSVPTSVDEDLARQYGLELLDRTELPELGLRIVQFRASGDRATGPIITDLRNDQRVRRAQLNVRYGLPAQAVPTPEVSRLKGPAVVAKPEVVQPRSGRGGPSRIQIGQRPAANPQRKSVPARADAPLRVGRVGDVLSGGL
jgi:hypothetical protein